MEIPQENIFEFDNIGHDKINNTLNDLKFTVVAMTKPLSNRSGIGGQQLVGGIAWSILRTCVDLKTDQLVSKIKVST